MALNTAWIIGAGHSGSTLLGMMLGAHGRVFYAGEAKKAVFLGDESQPQRKRECKLCGAGCVIWGDMAGTDPDELYVRLRRKSGAAVVVDSTKGLTWVRARVATAEGAVILLTRDGRAVVNSRLRKYPEQAIELQIEKWKTQIAASEEFFQAFAGPKTRVAYEDLALDPEATLRRIFALLELEFDDAALRFESSEQHPLGGNNGTQSLVQGSLHGPVVGARHGTYYTEHPGGVVLDLRWKEEMSDEALRLFDILAAEANRPYASNAQGNEAP